MNLTSDQVYISPGTSLTIGFYSDKSEEREGFSLQFRAGITRFMNLKNFTAMTKFLQSCADCLKTLIVWLAEAFLNLIFSSGFTT